jgi:type IV pilus assembly protein PilP
MTSAHRLLSLAFGAALGLAACGQHDKDAPAPAGTPASPASAPKMAASSATQAVTVTSSAPASGATTAVTEGVVVRRFKPARDPFRSVFEIKNRAGGGGSHPLQQFTIPQLKLLGIIWGIANPVALIATPNRQEFTVKVGTPVGTGDGKVVSILPDRVVIVERYYDYRGTLQTEKYEMILPGEE